jgi:uncharacterized membrane protein YsdA (DUF1294 family)
LLVSAAFLLLLAGLVAGEQLPVALAALYVVASGLAFVAYRRDKSAAREQRPRTPERRLHLIALLGGWPGALAAQQVLRHKSAKPSFRLVFRLTVLANCGALGAWLWLARP